ncbi:MAG: PilN domain-containing protein [Ostreibacterium sp.]
MAIQFNLLPWREEKRQQRGKQNKVSLLAALGIGVLIGLGYYAWESQRLNDHEKAFQFVQQKNKILEPQLKEKRELDALKIRLNKQIDSIESLQANRASASHMVEELSQANVQQVFLTKFNLIDGNVNIVGIAENDSQISDLMKRLRESQWYQEPKLLEIVSQPKLGEEVKRFSITSKLLLPGSEVETKGKKNG